MLGDKQLTENFRLGFSVGANFMYQKNESLNAGVRNMLDKGQWIFNAANMLNTAGESGFERATNSVFGSVQLAWKEYLSLDLTARNDWSSTLPQQNNSFFYPSANLSFVISDFVRSLDKPLSSWITILLRFVFQQHKLVKTHLLINCITLTHSNLKKVN